MSLVPRSLMIGALAAITLVSVLGSTTAGATSIQISDLRVDQVPSDPVHDVGWPSNPHSFNGVAALPGGGDINNPSPDPVRTETRAGAHPDIVMGMRFCPYKPDAQLYLYGCTREDTDELMTDLTVHLPPGMLGNPNAVGLVPCPRPMFLLFACGPESRIGVVEAYTIYDRAPAADPNGQLEAIAPLYVVETFGLEPARLGTGHIDTADADPPGPFESKVSLRSGDFGVDAVTNDLPNQLGSQRAKIQYLRIGLFGKLFTAPGSPPFMVNPTSCDPAQVGVEATAKDGSQSGNTTADVTPTDCENEPFDPAIQVQQDMSTPDGTTQAGAPSAYKVNITLPLSEADPRHQAHIKTTDVALPEGVSLSPAAGKTLKGCDFDDFGVNSAPGDPLTFNDAPVKCSADSRIADINVTTPILPTPLTGHAYFGTPTQSGQPTEAHPWKLFFLIEGSGVRVKLAGDTFLADNGQVMTKFGNPENGRLPQTPFTNFELKLRGGEDAILINPRRCGAHNGAAHVVGWNNVNGNGVRDITPSVTTTGCTDPEPFQPSVDAFADDMSAGASSPSHLIVDRADGQSLMKNLSFQLPEGLVGSLRKAPECPINDARAGSCDAGSKVGNLRVTAGVGAATLQVPGELFLAEPAEPGDAASLSAVIPAKVGPIDLGKVVVINHIKLRPEDGGLNAITEDFPTVLGGIPISVKHIAINVDRDGFLTNPTSCEPRDLKGDFNSDTGTSATASVTLSATNCERLPFSPKLRLIAEGKNETKRFAHPALRAIVTQEPGQANINGTIVKLPESLRPELPVIQKSLCTTPQFEAGQCKPAAIIGNAVAHTPLLPTPLTGPVYLIQDPNPIDPLPRIIVRLSGIVSIDLSARNTIEGVRTVNTFRNIPDVPVTRFELFVKGGNVGILKTFYDICEHAAKGDATFFGQNGKVHTSRPLLETPACDSGVAALSIRTSSVRMSKKGVVPIKVRCGSQACNGKLAIEKGGAAAAKVLGSKKFSAGANATRTVKVKLNRKTRKSVLKRKKLSATTSVKVGQAQIKKKITIRAPKKAKRKRH